MKIVILDGYTLNPGDLSWEKFNTFGEVKIYDRTSKEMIVERIGKAEIVIVNKTKITKEIIDSCPNIKYIGVLAAGYDNVDTDYAKIKNIVVTTTPGYSQKSVVQLVFALILEIAHHSWEHNLAVKRGEWKKKNDFCFWNYPLIELEGKTLGIIGAGKIGMENIPIAKSFGMNILVFDEYKNEKIIELGGKYVNLDNLLQYSDIITLHCPLFESNKEFINNETIKRMKDGVILINTSRGGLIKEDDVAQALNTGKIGYFAADVVSKEPIEETNPLFNAKNCILTPHIAWAPKESRERLMNIAIKNIQGFLKGKIINNIK
ncbi:MAG: D-2-hydroxyacid dehydrogenase [Fusobacteriaceae bacterium]